MGMAHKEVPLVLRLILLTAALVAGVAAADLSGRWSGTVEWNGVPVPAWLILDLHGSEPSGMFASGDANRQIPIDAIQAAGDEIAFEVQGLPFHLRFHDGRLEGDHLTLTRVVGPARQYTFRGQNSDPVVLRRVDPEPAGVQGTVVLQVEVAPDGRPQNIRVAKGLGSALNELAVEAVKRWAFKPAYKNGKPVSADLTVEVNFQ